MISYPVGSIIAKKVLPSNDFKEEVVDLSDFPLNTSGSSFSEVGITGASTQQGFDSLPAKFLRNYVIVKRLSDLPSSSGGTITLSGDTTYHFNGDINFGTTNLKISEGTRLIGNNKEYDIITYSGSSDFILATGVNFELDNFSINSPISTSHIFNISGTTQNYKISRIHFGMGSNVASLGTFHGGNILFFNECEVTKCSGGLTITGVLDHLFYINNYIDENLGTFKAITLGSGSTFEDIHIVANHFDLSSGQVLLSAPNSLVISGGLNILSNSITGSGIALFGGILNTNLYLNIFGNSSIDDTKALGYIKFDANTTATVVSSSSTYYVASGTNSATVEERFDCSVNNRIKYTGVLKSPITVNILLTGAVSCASANETLKIAVYKFTALTSTSALVGECEVRGTAVNQAESFSYNDIISMATNDYLEVRVRNTTDTTNIIVEYMQLRVVNR